MASFARPFSRERIVLSRASDYPSASGALKPIADGFSSAIFQEKGASLRSTSLRAGLKTRPWSARLAHDIEHVVHDDVGIEVHQQKVRVDNPVVEILRK